MTKQYHVAFMLTDEPMGGYYVAHVDTLKEAIHLMEEDLGRDVDRDSLLVKQISYSEKDA